MACPGKTELDIEGKVVVEYKEQSMIEGEIQNLSGFAIEDFSTLLLTSDLAEKYDIGSQMDMVPPIKEPKNIYYFILILYKFIISVIY